MKLHWDFSALHTIALTLGASAVPFHLNRASQIDAIEALLVQGISIDLSQVGSTAGLLTYEGRQVLLYIPDQGSNITNLLKGDKSAGKRFHVAECETLISMRENHRFERYIATTDVSGKFKVHGLDLSRRAMDGQAALHVCINCLKHLNYQQAQVQGPASRVRDEFNLFEFFGTYSSCFTFLPKRTQADTGSSTYTEDWPIISRNLRLHQNWTCSACHVNLAEHRHLLHVHHVDGVKNNNRSANLKVLCAACHKNQPLHEHMIVSLADRKTINTLRVKQELVPRDWPSVMAYADPALHGILGVLKYHSWPVPLLEFLPPGMGTAVELAWPEQSYAISLSSLDARLDNKWVMHTVDTAWKHALVD